jgi:hypothetical protein
MKQFIFTLILILTVSIPAFSQTKCVKVDSVWVDKKVKQIGTRNVLLGIKQVTEEIISEKYDLCDSNATSIKIQVWRIGAPSNSFRVGGVGQATQTTQVYIKMYFGDKVIEGLGESETKAGYIMLELTEGKVPFSNSTIGNAIKKAITHAVSQL